MMLQAFKVTFCFLMLSCFLAVEASWWIPSPGTTWQWQLVGEIDKSYNVKMYDIDLDTPQADIDALRAAGRIVICYFSAGSYENYRDDAALFPTKVLGEVMDGWPDERWLDIRTKEVRDIMSTRLDRAVTKRCHGVEPDNVDAYTTTSGFPLTANDQLTYNTWLATEAHKRNLSIGLKNDLLQVKQLYKSFDWAINEQCNQYNECSYLDPFITDGKAVFGVEYSGSPSVFCPKMVAKRFSWMKKNLDLTARRVDCFDNTTWKIKP